MSLIHAHLKDRVVWVKKNGEKQDNILALIQKDKIFMDDISLKIEEGDKIARKLPNGIEELYLITYIDYVSGFGGIDHMEIDVEKEKAIRNIGATHVEYHQHGNTEQVNINSSRASFKKIDKIEITNNNIFMQLKNAIEENVAEEDAKSDLLQQVEVLENAQGQKVFSNHYNEFIASAANHATLLTAIAPIIPKLYQKFLEVISI
jgi:hypothetical protein